MPDNWTTGLPSSHPHAAASNKGSRGIGGVVLVAARVLAWRSLCPLSVGRRTLGIKREAGARSRRVA